MENAGYLIALAVTVFVLAMLLGAGHYAALRIKRRRPEEEPSLPFDEPTPAEMSEEERLLRVIFGELKSRKRRRAASRESSASDVHQSAEERSSS